MLSPLEYRKTIQRNRSIEHRGDFSLNIGVFLQKNPPTARPKRDGGRWGVVPSSEHQEILVALASLIRAQRYDMALTILYNELGGGCRNFPRKIY